MKNRFYLILSALILCFGTSWSQKIKYERTFEEAQKVSGEQNKPLAILLTIEPPAHVTNFMRGLSDEEVVNTFNSNFVNFKIDRSDTASRKIIKRYSITNFPSFIFLDSKGGLMFKEIASLSFPQKLMATAKKALVASKEKSLVDFDNEYKSGDYTADFLKAYIDKRMKAGLFANADLIEKYVDFLTIADLDDYQQVLFIMQSGPLADGRAYKLAYTNRKIIDSIYKREPFEVRTAINNRIIGNTMASAIAAKSMTRATAAANIARSTWGKNYMEGQKNHSLKMLQYYRAVQDTTNYLRNASYFYDQHYMNIGADSIKRMDQKNMEKLKSAARERAMSNMPEGSGLKSFSYTYAANNFSTQLNNGAYSFYQTGTQNPTYLTKAILWSKRSIELNPVSGYYDTLAHLLYRIGFYSEAETTQQKAIELAKAEKRNVKDLQDGLIKIRNKTL